MSADPLPIDPYLGDIVQHVQRSRALVVTAQPGAGKTTRIPPALLDAGPLILLQPRRVAVRAMARRIADERGWTIGREIGWQIRFERRFTDATRLLVATEGVLTARLQRDPLLSGFRTIVIDEFHERSVYADVALALAKQAWHARDDLRIVVMSATLDAAAVSSFLDGCPIVDVPGRVFPIDLRYSPQSTIAAAAMEALEASPGDVLCFLPGAGEIRRAISDLELKVSRGVDLVALHGSLDAAEQDLALRPSSRRRIVVATNIAETSVTVPGVTAVVDSGMQKVARYDAERGIDSLDAERITADAAEQRAGRAGRTAPGIVWRLWDARDRLRPRREPEIHRIDLSATVLDVIAWGGDPRHLEWFERPREDALGAALHLLERLGAIREARLTALGDQIRRLPIHPRLARMLIAAGGAREIARACALLSERHFIPPRAASTSSDLLSAIDAWPGVPPHVQAVAREIEELAGKRAGKGVGRHSGSADLESDLVGSEGLIGENYARRPLSETRFRRAVLAGYPDRVAQRRQPLSPRVRLASGAGAVVGRESGVVQGEFLVALDVHSVANDSRIRVASRVEREWLIPSASEIVHRFDPEAGVVRALEIDRYDALILAEHPTKADPEIAATLLADAWLERGPRGDDDRLLKRLRFADVSVDVSTLVRAAARTARSLDDVNLARALPPDLARALDRDAPVSLRIPSGRMVPLEYRDDGGVAASVKLQELFGLADTPRIGKTRMAVLFALLAPNGRSVQLTRDLRSFWEKTYPEVRKELRGRYPKHPWPENPWNATPTSRIAKAKGKR
jgi:ATP-dependent helicase HrpB